MARLFLRLVRYWRGSSSAPARASSRRLSVALRVGQEWRFEGRPSDADPRLVIVRLESDPRLGELAHISVRGVHTKNPHHGRGYVEEAPHMPFSRLAVEASVTELVSDSVPLPAYQDGYTEWKRSAGGALTVSVRDALDVVEQTLKGSGQ